MKKARRSRNDASRWVKFYFLYGQVRVDARHSGGVMSLTGTSAVRHGGGVAREIRTCGRQRRVCAGKLRTNYRLL